MPLRVFDFKGNASEANIIKAMNYAIDNHANIINLSLGQTQFAYSTKYDDVIRRAYENGVVVVIAAGN
jgi:cell wall-associated protease